MMVKILNAFKWVKCSFTLVDIGQYQITNDVTVHTGVLYVRSPIHVHIQNSCCMCNHTLLVTCHIADKMNSVSISI